MSDGMSDAKEEEKAAALLDRAMRALENLFNATHDAAFGPNSTVVAELNRLANRSGLRVDLWFGESWKTRALAAEAKLEEKADATYEAAVHARDVTISQLRSDRAASVAEAARLRAALEAIASEACRFERGATVHTCIECNYATKCSSCLARTALAGKETT